MSKRAKWYNVTEEGGFNPTWPIQEGFQEEKGGGHGDGEGQVKLKWIQKIEEQT